MNTEYRARFRPIGNGNVRRSFEEKVAYRRRRRQLEGAHVPFYWENGVLVKRTPSPPDDQRRPTKDISLPDADVHFPRAQIPTISPAMVPKLDLEGALTPSPRASRPRKRSKVVTPTEEDGVVDSQVQTTVRLRARSKDTATQTPARWQSMDNVSEATNDDFTRQLRSGRVLQRSQSPPFAPYGIGDKERTVAGKRTFNIKANGRSQVYESARKAARLKHLPLPQKTAVDKYKIHHHRVSNSKNRVRLLDYN